MSSQSPPDGTGLLWAEIEWKVFLSLVEDTEFVAVLGVDNSEDFGDGLAHVMTVGLPNVSIGIVQSDCVGCLCRP